MKRICIYTKDIQIITGKSERYARNVLIQIRKHYNKQKYQVVSVGELCDYLGLNIDEVKELLK